MGEVLRNTVVRRLWYAQIVSQFGDFLALFAVIGVLTFKLHATPEQVTGVQISYMVPIAVLGVIAGVFVDRWPLKITLVSSDLIRAGLTLLLIFCTSIWHFYAVMAAISVVSSFFGPAQGVTVRSSTPLHGLRAANGLMMQVMFIMRIIGPAVAGWLVAAFGPRSCYIGDTISFVASACFIVSIAIRQPDARQEENTHTGLTRVLHDMQTGIKFIVHHATLFFMMLAMAAGMFTVGCFGPLIAIYVRDTVHASTRTFGFVSGSIGLGILLGINVLNTVGKKFPNTLLVYFGLGGIGAGLLVLAAFSHIYTAILGCILVGFCVSCIIVPSQTLIQMETPAHLMGRVGSTSMSAIFGAQVLGLPLSGVLAQLTSVRTVFICCAVFLALLIVIGKLWMEPKPAASASA